MVLNKKNITFTLIFLALVLESLLSMLFSIPLAVTSSIIGFIIVLINRTKIKKYFYFLLFFPFYHAIIITVFDINDQFNFSRFSYSYMLYMLFIFAAYQISKNIQKIKNIKFYIYMKVFFILIYLDGFIAGLKIILLHPKKETFLFSEPSHLAILLGIGYIYWLIRFKGNFKVQLFIFLFVFLLSLLLKSMTLLVIALFYFLLLAMTLKKFILFLPIFLPVLMNIFSDPYYSDRIKITDETNHNITALVYSSGWERSFIDLSKSSGMGIGLNQFGYNNTMGKYQKILAAINLEKLNIHDGGSNGSKIISEFGVVGIILLFIYFWYMIKIVINIRNKKILYEINIFTYSIFLSYFIPLFVRGYGYFNIDTLLFLSSIVYLSSKKKRHHGYIRKRKSVDNHILLQKVAIMSPENCT